jgi:hypothetical protein
VTVTAFFSSMSITQKFPCRSGPGFTRRVPPRRSIPAASWMCPQRHRRGFVLSSQSG